MFVTRQSDGNGESLAPCHAGRYNIHRRTGRAVASITSEFSAPVISDRGPLASRDLDCSTKKNGGMKMTLRELPLKKAYMSDVDDVLADFFIPALEVSTQYNRLAAFFSSSSLAVAAMGILGLIRNGGSMRLVVCPRFSRADAQTILVAKDNPEVYLTRYMLSELEELQEGFVKDHVSALGWMVANDQLEIRVCIPRNEPRRLDDFRNVDSWGIFHPKVGILQDSEENCVTFSGSINESASGWMHNSEEFKVFRSWEPVEKEYQQSDLSNFDRFWNGTSPTMKTMSIPEAVQERLVQLAPNDIENLALERWTQRRSKARRRQVTLFDYQNEAVQAWLANEMRGIFEMATGTGKTFTALGCIEEAFASGVDGAIIATPFQHLSQQWIREIEKFGIDHGDIVVADSSRPRWKDRLADSLIDLSLGHKHRLLVLTTHASLSLADFRDIVAENRGKSRLLLIADEVHGLGAKESRQRLSEEYNARLGLSATPHRWFDDVGTAALMEYFGGVVYEFPLERAINTVNPATGTTFLTPYRYELRFASLSQDEIAEYLQKTQALIYARGKSESKLDEDDWFERLLYARADIVKNAQAKYAILGKIVDDLGKDIRWTLVYCSPQQIDTVVGLLNDRSLSLHRFTMEEGTTPSKNYQGRSEREHILDRFAEGEYQTLVAMKCLDEGVDVPAARTAVLMCSSSNPREYIQRIGRVIRRFQSKTVAMIYDIVVAPSIEMLPADLREVERRIFEKEMTRCKEIARTAENISEALIALDDIMNRVL